MYTREEWPDSVFRFLALLKRETRNVKQLTDDVAADLARAVGLVIEDDSGELCLSAKGEYELALWKLTTHKRDTPGQLIATPVAVQEFHVSRTTLGRYVASRKLTDHRPPNHPPNQTLIFDENELAKQFQRRNP